MIWWGCPESGSPTEGSSGDLKQFNHKLEKESQQEQEGYLGEGGECIPTEEGEATAQSYVSSHHFSSRNHLQR